MTHKTTLITLQVLRVTLRVLSSRESESESFSTVTDSIMCEMIRFLRQLCSPSTLMSRDMTGLSMRRVCVSVFVRYDSVEYNGNVIRRR